MTVEVIEFGIEGRTVRIVPRRPISTGKARTESERTLARSVEGSLKWSCRGERSRRGRASAGSARGRTERIVRSVDEGVDSGKETSSSGARFLLWIWNRFKLVG